MVYSRLPGSVQSIFLLALLLLFILDLFFKQLRYEEVFEHLKVGKVEYCLTYDTECLIQAANIAKQIEQIVHISINSIVVQVSLVDDRQLDIVIVLVWSDATFSDRCDV